MSVEVFDEEGELGPFASNSGYSDLIAASQDNPALKRFFDNASAEDDEVNAVAEELKKLAAGEPSDIAETAETLLRLIYGHELVYISNGTYDKPDDGEEVDKGGPGSGPQGGKHSQTAIHVERASGADIAKIQEEVNQGRFKGRARSAQDLILGMTTKSAYNEGSVPVQNLVARGDDGTFLGALQGTMFNGRFEIDTLAVNPRILNGDIAAKGTGTRLMQEAARVAGDYPIHLTSMDSQSDKFYQALGMSHPSPSRFEWNPTQVKAVAQYGVHKADEEFDAEAVLNAAREVEDEILAPLAGRLSTKKSDTDYDYDFELPGTIIKVDKDQHLVFGFFSVSQIDGKNITDTQGDVITPAVLESAAYDFVLNARKGGEMHEADKDGVVKGIGRLIESVVFTTEKQKAMLKSLHDQGIKEAVLDLKCICWFGGFHVDNMETWEKIVSGELKAFSIGGRGKRAVL